MNPVTNHLIDLCENLQKKIDLLEAGLKRAILSTNPELKEKELGRQKFRAEFHINMARRHREAAESIRKNFGPYHPKYGAHNLAAETHENQAKKIAPNIEDLAMELDIEHPEKRSRIKTFELGHESPFGTDAHPITGSGHY